MWQSFKKPCSTNQMYSPAYMRKHPLCHHQTTCYSHLYPRAGETHQSESRSRLVPAALTVLVQHQWTPPHNQTPNTPSEPWAGTQKIYLTALFSLLIYIPYHLTTTITNSWKWIFKTMYCTKIWTQLWSTQTCDHCAWNLPVQGEGGWSPSSGCWL